MALDPTRQTPTEPSPTDQTPDPMRRFTRAGSVAQGLALGFLIVLAAMELASLAGGLSPFKYQGF